MKWSLNYHSLLSLFVHFFRKINHILSHFNKVPCSFGKEASGGGYGDGWVGWIACNNFLNRRTGCIDGTRSRLSSLPDRF